MNVCAALLIPSTRATIDEELRLLFHAVCGPPRTPNTASFPLRKLDVNLQPPTSKLQNLVSIFLLPTSACLCSSVSLSPPSSQLPPSTSFSFPTKEAMALFIAFLLSLVFLASLANILFRLPPKKLQVLLRSLFPEPPVPHPASSNATASEQPPWRQGKERPAMSAERRAELRRVFATFDRNGDGLITREELRESLRGLRISVSDAEVAEAVAGSDANGDGRIDLDEFCSLLESMSAVEKSVGGGGGEERGGEEAEAEAELREAFDVFDGDGDGVITVEELGRVLSSLGMSEGKRAEACEEMIRKVDVDGDGMINFDEFKKMMRSGQTLLVSAY